ncbi:helix-turn-helix domain-containing protein [Halobacteriovorax sp. ZH1_bin.1]|uniref:helix-turn-helix domain-containing protein n=1 Tax=Halobacteriovorax sp. ZH1_bin.1 TaxID=3157723 RepID=UPI003714C69B
MKGKIKRHHRTEMTPEAKALRELRLDRQLSIREVCRQLGKSEAFLRHIETGRRDFPRKILLETILQVYEVSYKAFRHKVTAVREVESKLGPKEELKELIDRLPEDKLIIVQAMLKGVLEAL